MKTLIYDLTALAGVASIGTGVAMWSIPASLCVVGTLLLAGGLAGAHSRAKRGP